MTMLSQDLSRNRTLKGFTMPHYKFILSLMLIPFLTACSFISSSIHYTRGTEHLEAGEYELAISELNKAVALNPNMARNHNNLVCAYIALKEWDKAWYHSRQAVLCSIQDSVRSYYFDFFCENLIHQPGLDAIGTNHEEIIGKLGTPEMAMYDLESHVLEMCCYGVLSMKFKDGKLIECKRLDQEE